MKYSRKWKQHSGFVLLWTATEAAHPPQQQAWHHQASPQAFCHGWNCVCEQLCVNLRLLCSSISRMCLIVSLLYIILVYGNVSQKHLLPDGGGKFALKCNCSLANTYGWGAETLQTSHHIPDHNDTPVRSVTQNDPLHAQWSRTLCSPTD